MSQKNIIESYLKLGAKIDSEKYIVAHFYLEADPKIGMAKAAEAIAGESSIGTWTRLSTMSNKIFRHLAPVIFYLNSSAHHVKIAYPLSLFEPGNLPQLLSSIGGNIFSMKVVKNLRLENIELPQKYINSFKGPQFGISGVRNILKIYDRPLIGCIMKPKVGLTAQKTAELAYDLFTNGVDVIKDDENLTSLPFNTFSERARRVIASKKKAEEKTGVKKIYVFNVTAPADLMLERARLIKKLGGNCVMVDVVSLGWGAVQYLRNKNLGLVIHGHRAGHSTFSRNPKHGVTMLVLAKLARLAGIDQFHTGTVVGKMEGGKEEVIGINRFLEEDWGRLKSVLPIASGGLYPGSIPALIKILGNEVIINFGGGIHGHPGGSTSGARAALQAVEATQKKISLDVYSRNHPELKKAIEYWGTVKY